MWVACVQAALQMWKPCQSLYADIVNDFGTESGVHLNPAEKNALQVTVGPHSSRDSLLTNMRFFRLHRKQVCVPTRLKNMTKPNVDLRFQSQD